jgi:putative DNA primase/helicase
VENECLFNVFGNYARSIDPETLMQSKRQAGAASPDIVELQGIRLAIGSETGKGRKFNGEKVKKLTGNDKLKGRNLFSGYIEFSPSHKLVLCTNFKPNADADDFAFWQRVCLIPYPLSFVENPHAANERKADLKLLEKLKSESSGILAWLVRGCLAWQKEGLNPPACIQKATEEYRAEEDTIGQFIDECCIKGTDKIVKVSALTDKYVKWCTDTGNEAVRIKDFRKVIEQRFKKLPPKNTGIYYSGIGLLEE